MEFSTVTVAVVTGARQEGAFAQLETIMVERLGADEGASRLIVMARAPGLTTFGLRPRLWLDVTDDSTLDAAIGTVVRECRHGA